MFCFLTDQIHMVKHYRRLFVDEKLSCSDRHLLLCHRLLLTLSNSEDILSRVDRTSFLLLNKIYIVMLNITPVDRFDLAVRR